MNKIIQFGETVPGYPVAVLNEREIRASAGILFLIIFIGLMLILFNGDFLMVKYTVTVFLADFLVRVFINPRYAPSLIIGRLIVRNQTPEYVGAKQKRFAWIIGLFLSATMFTFLVVVNAYSPITGFGCLFCLIFLFFESAFGICLGCKFYSLIYKDKTQYCTGEICDAKSRQPIQKTSGSQWLIILALIAFIFMLVYLFSPQFHKKPYYLFRKSSSANIK